MYTLIRTRAAQAVALLVITAMCLFSAQAANAVDRSPTGSADKQVAHTTKGTMKSKISGTANKGREVSGSFVPLKFINRGGQPYVKGLVQGVVHERNGSKTTFSQLKTFPLQSASGAAGRAGAGTSARATCDILHLVLGPLDLNLLGLK